MLFAVGDIVWQALIAAVVVLVQAYMTERNRRAAAQDAKEAAVKVEEVKKTTEKESAKTSVKLESVKEALQETSTATDKKLDGMVAEQEGMKRVQNATHVLVNSNMGVQLKLNAVVTRRLASMTKDALAVAVRDNASLDTIDILKQDVTNTGIAADLAEHMLVEHESKQRTVDGMQ